MNVKRALSLKNADADQLEKWCSRRGRTVKFIFIAYVAVGVLLAFLTPSNILDHSWANTLMGITALAVPNFLDVPASSPIPDVVRFYFGVMWLLMPLFYCCLIIELFKWPAICTARPQAIKSLKSKWRATFFYLFLLLFAFVSFYLSVTHLYQPEDGRITRHLFSSRLSLATWATLYNSALLGVAGAVLSVPRSMYHSWSKLP